MQIHVISRNLFWLVTGALLGKFVLLGFIWLKKSGFEIEAWVFSTMIGVALITAAYVTWSVALSFEGKKNRQNPTANRRKQFERERAARQTAEKRAKQAETEAIELRRQLESAKSAYEALRRESRELHNGWEAAQVESTRKGEELAAVTAELERLRSEAVQQSAKAEQDPIEAKPSHLLAIAALAELLKSPVDRPRPQGLNQEAIKSAILEGFPWRGLSDRNLQTIFAAANKAKADAE